MRECLLSNRLALVVLICSVGLAFSVELAAIIISTNGHFTYSLDDPYIHLTLAKRIAHGHYGLNAVEVSSPASSILWPLVLAPFSELPGFEFVPLVLNLGFTIGSAAVLYLCLRGRLTSSCALVGTGVLLLGLNLVGVAFTGMEHSLQVLFALIVGQGVLTVIEGRPLPWWLPVAMVLGPLVRYENAGPSMAAATILVSLRFWRPAVVSTLAWMAGVGGFSIFLLVHDLDMLPSSVLAKSHYIGLPLELAIRLRVLDSFSHWPFLVAVGVTVLDGLMLLRWGREHLFILLVLAAQMLGGSFGWFGRYELYALAAVTPLIGKMLCDWLAATDSRRRALGLATTGAALLSLTSLASVTLSTPAAARDVWSQQGQTAAFVRDYWQRPIAVNDIGLVAYRSGRPVLDLWGLASQDARRARMAGDPRWMERMVRRSEVGAVAIYSDWFPGRPSEWTLVGQITGARNVASAERTVDFYAVTRRDVPALCAGLNDFARNSESPVTRVSLSPGCEPDEASGPVPSRPIGS